MKSDAHKQHYTLERNCDKKADMLTTVKPVQKLILLLLPSKLADLTFGLKVVRLSVWTLYCRMKQQYCKILLMNS